MINKSTNQLMNSLRKSNTPSEYLNEEENYIIDEPLAVYLNNLLKAKGLSKSSVVKNADINEIYGYQILSGTRTPSRDKLISIAFGMNLDIEETQQLLKYANYAPLYPKNKRDSIILWCIEHKYNIRNTNEELYSQEEETL